MKKEYKKRYIVPFVLASLILAGCGEVENCNIENRHLHRYHKNISNDIGIDTYLDSEISNISGFTRTDDYLEVTYKDAEILELLQSKMLFNAKDNIGYLYYLLSTKHDYFSFYYEYENVNISTSYDGDGWPITTISTDIVNGWHENAHDFNNTGDVKLCHHRYYGYRIACSNGKFFLEQSPIVDDIRDIIDEYPLVSEKPFTIVYEKFNFPKSELSNLDINDFDVFTSPNLEDNNYIYQKK